MTIRSPEIFSHHIYEILIFRLNTRQKLMHILSRSFEVNEVSFGALFRADCPDPADLRLRYTGSAAAAPYLCRRW